MFRTAARASLDRMDRWWANVCAQGRLRRPHVAVALFHVMHRSREEARGHTLASNQQVTMDDLRRFLDAMLRTGYTVVSSDQLRHGSSEGAKQLLLTFDDGYYNNVWALPVLQEFQAPATFFISTSHVLQGKAFWWDAVSRRLLRSGKSRGQVDAALRSLKDLPPQAIEDRVRQEFGADTLAPAGDDDRPFTPGELRDFARDRWVSLGNHTSGHTILTQCSPEEAKDAIRQGKEELEGMAGVAVDSIAYPNGNYSAGVVQAARDTGHDLGFTCVAKSNPIAPDAGARLTLGRHLIHGGADYTRLAPALAAPFLPGTMIRAAWRR